AGCPLIMSVNADTLVRPALGWPAACEAAGLDSSRLVEMRSLEVPDFVLGFVAGNPVACLDRPDELIAPAGDDVELVVGQLAPGFLDLPLELLPVAFHGIPVHQSSLLLGPRVAPVPISPRGTARCGPTPSIAPPSPVPWLRRWVCVHGQQSARSQ